MCGIVGIHSDKPVAYQLYDGLMMLQHRGQDAAGMVTYDNRHLHIHKGDGVASVVFNESVMSRLKGNIGMGHVRYPTAGTYDSAEAQPFYVNAPFGITLIHNGNLTNTSKLRDEVMNKHRRHLNTQSDSEVLLNILADELDSLDKDALEPDDVFKAMEGVFKRVKGGYAVIAIIADQGILAFRDPHAIRPLIMGKRGVETIFASESVALDVLGFETDRDLKPGEAVFVDMDGKVHTKVCAEKTEYKPCIFEYVYFARPDSMLDDISVYKARLRMGEQLADQIKAANLDIDVVIPVPSTSRHSAVPLAYELGVKYREGLVKNRYVARTFIMPGQEERQNSVRRKLNPLQLEIRNKNILLVDDSIVRGNTSKKIVELVRDMGAKKVYFASCAPPLRHPCVYGIDMPSRKEFVANQLTTEETAKQIGADALFYQTLDNLHKAVSEGNPRVSTFCMACFDGNYPTDDVTEEILKAAEENRCSDYVRPDSSQVLN
ncbi:amidophosphoribosyltransferase [Candidatus Peregrinibacteria bacterium]|jgi:amidophosphoribosyltransferase|nr:amidophosphoribosyltransferase [Candidatus Peregrinibacteria bacterium]MBT4631343.1 amidophosphoribosyltransferase [Candidatus Peregrinibacteria bacterium]MBT5516722.1 amidophosphoribosyltransferase [Candidatus Peregrinibacteria bacterium]MBT5823782.1 amidophosphoribosyltransferase [Candidatus Peregrinibacteria bacterium]